MRYAIVAGIIGAALLPQFALAQDLPSPAVIMNTKAQQQDELPLTVAEEAQEPSGAIPALPLQVMQMGQVRFINGGISDEELDQLKLVSSSYNFQLLIVGKGGEYVSDVAIRVTDGSGKLVFSLPDAGPYLYMNMVPGAYAVEATYLGNVQKFNVKPSSGHTSKLTVRVAP